MEIILAHARKWSLIGLLVAVVNALAGVIIEEGMITDKGLKKEGKIVLLVSAALIIIAFIAYVSTVR